MKSSVADPEPGSGAFYTPEEVGIRDRFSPDLGSQTQIDNFWVKSTIFLRISARIFL
jgi:hypothetical protein